MLTVFTYIVKLAVVCAVCLCASCGVLPQRAADTLYMHLTAEPDTLNPITATDAYSSSILGHIYETLLERDRDTLGFKPCLAESYEISVDKTRYIFHLKRDVLWNDGAEFTADDVVYSYKVIKDPLVACAQLKVYYIDIKDCRKIDKYTVEFTYSRPYFLALEFCGGMPIIPKHIFDDGTDFNSHKNSRFPIGTGPYKFVRWKTGASIELAANDKYRDAQPQIKTVVYKVIPEGNVALQMLKKGDLDIMSVRTIQWERQTTSDKFTSSFYKLNYYQPNYSYIGWNARRPFFADKYVRRAMTMLVNREAILQKLQFGHGKIVSGTFYISSPAYDANIKPWPYDPSAAVQLLKSAGWEDTNGDGVLDKDGVDFSFTMTVPSGAKFSERLAVMIKEDFKKVGIEVSVNRYEWAVFVNKVQAHDFDAVTMGWSLGYSSDPYQLWHSSQREAGSNYCGFANAEADNIIVAARMEFNEDKRNAMYRRFHGILHEEQPYTFLFCNPELVVVSKRFENVIVHTAGLHLEEWTLADSVQEAI